MTDHVIVLPASDRGARTNSPNLYGIMDDQHRLAILRDLVRRKSRDGRQADAGRGGSP